MDGVPVPPPAAAPVAGGRAQAVVRRILLFTILFALIVVAAIGVSGLVARILGIGTIVRDDAGLARSLAFALIAAPLAGLLWWWQRRRLAEPAERASLVWALYLTAVSLVALVVATVSLASAATAALDGRWRPEDVASGIVWLAVWIWHRAIARNSAIAPTRLVGVTARLSALYGLLVAAIAAIAAVATLIGEALAAVVPVIVGTSSWTVSVLQSLVWCTIGVAVWVWHWFVEDARRVTGTFAAVLLVVVVGGAAATTLVAVGIAVFTLLRLVVGVDPVADILAPVDNAVAAMLIGGLVWAYHGAVLAGAAEAPRRAARLVVAAVALIGAATGFGVVVNALLATVGDAIVVEDTRTLLLGGLSALVVGAPVWWFAWRPTRAVGGDEASEPARRVYLVAVFGASAIVAIVTLLLIGYRLFESILDTGGGGLLDRVRAPLGVLTATVLVFAYHFAVWRRDRALAPAAAGRHTVGRVLLVTAGEASALEHRIRTDVGAAVTSWRGASDGVADADADAVVHALEGLAAPRVLVVSEPGGGVRVIPLDD